MEDKQQLEANLRSAALSRQSNVVEQLLAAGVNPNATDGFDNTAILYAALHGDGTSVSLLLRYGADPNRANRSGYTALMVAAGHGLDSIVSDLLNHGASWAMRVRFDVKEVGPPGATALSLARQNHHPSTVDLLTKAGAKY